MPGARLDGVTKRYGRNVALADVTLAADPAEILGIVGPNGAGKTTLLRVLARLIRPDSGSVGTAGVQNPVVVRYFGGEHTLPPGVPARRWLRLWRAPSAAAAGRRRLGELSRGTRQRIGLEAALAEAAPSLLLLDEPWEGLDPDASRWLSAALVARRNAGAAIVVSSHRIHDLADVCDRCVFLVAGRLAAESLGPSDLAGAADRSALLYAAFDRVRQPC
jgi:ABC-2 type transport system ATP-binding protein